jgi:signal transduction histidine kinase/DNA-binding NarL/FixJ family response regulator
MTDSLKTKLGESLLFKGLEPKMVAKILEDSRVTSYTAGEVLVRKGEIPKALYLVTEGKVLIYNEDVLLAEAGPMAILGESFLAEASASATLVAAEGLRTMEIPREMFYRLSMEHPQLVVNIFRINFERLRSSNETALREARTREEKLEQKVQERTAALNQTLRELKSTNDELSETRDHLLETQKFRQQFLANMSHEIRTPMNAIVGLTNLLLKGQLNEQQDKYLRVIQKSGHNLLVIINDILDLAKIESGKMELEAVPFPLVNATQNVHTILSLKAQEKGIGLETKIDPNVPEYVLGDETRITQVIMNLAGNAIKFTEKGSVTISLSVEEKVKDSVRIRFSVKDTGIGIPADKLDTIFESFGQASSDTTRKFGGTGLGLTISKQLVEMHGGALQVASTPGQGSDFFFTIPYTVCEKPGEKNTHEDGKEYDLTGMKILLVEDNEFNQMVAVDSLQDLFPDIRVDVAVSGQAALDMLEKEDYSFIFMDIQMPEMDGYEATRRIRKLEDTAKRNIRICAMTANVTREEIDECSAAGMNDFMIKPYTTELLREKVLKNAFPGPSEATAASAAGTRQTERLREDVLAKLKQGLPSHLYYHGLHHTLDVLEAVERIGRSEEVTDDELQLLKAGALYHDIGFLYDAYNHEIVGGELAVKELPGYGFSAQEIEIIRKMILSTRYPQHPSTKLEQILCDADLDYLGRDDFFTIGSTLFRELIETGRINSEKEWNRLQVNFLSGHRYFTKTARSTREAKKEEHLARVKEVLAGS